VTRQRELQRNPTGATHMSWRAAKSPGFRGIIRLARASLLMAFDHDADRETASLPTRRNTGSAANPGPELTTYEASRRSTKCSSSDVFRRARRTFNVPIHSEDAGERLLANLCLDYGSPGTEGHHGSDRFALHGNVTDREISIPWTAAKSETIGCHTVSIVVAHLSSYSTNIQISVEKKTQPSLRGGELEPGCERVEHAARLPERAEYP